MCIVVLLTDQSSSLISNHLLYRARVQYLLSTSFYLPPACIQTLIDSITSYKQSLSLAPPLPETVDVASSSSSSTLPSPFTLDVLYNLGVSLQTLGELIEEIGSDTLSTSTGINLPSSKDLLSEAAQTFEQVSRGQSAVLQAQKQDEEADPSEEAVETQDEEMDEDDQEGDDDDSDGKVSAFTSSLITPASHLETLYSLFTVALTALSGANEVNSPSFSDSINLLDSALSRSFQVIASNPEGENMSAENEWLERITDLKYADLSWKVSQVTKMSELKEVNENSAWPSPQDVEDENSLKLLENQVLSKCQELIDSSIDKDNQNKLRDNQFRVQLLCDLGDSSMSLTRIRLRQFKNLSQLNSISPPIEILKTCWELSIKSTKAFNAALTALDTSSNAGAVVLGAANSSTQTSRTRASISNNLSILSLIRSDEILGEGFAGIVSAQSRRNLFDSARIWSRRSLSENGLGWILTFLSTSISKPNTICKEASNHPHSPGGWETLRNESDSIMTFLRVLFMKRKALISNQLPLASSLKPELLSQEEIEKKLMEEIKVTEIEIQCLSFIVWTLIRRKDDLGAWALSFISKPSQEVVVEGLEVNRFLDDLISEEGRSTLGMEERTFWNNWFTGIRNDVWSGIQL